ncbi:MAG TPA: alpha/beta hydrolase [Anaeromyxobacteraceae bacterium]|nr:alpha/beta hydrolase [Anaeromyxobacteraceae bacterium]
MAVITDIGTASHNRPTVLILPGWHGSGPGHWQTLWERARPELRRVEQASWSEPILGDWAEQLERAVRAAPSPALLVAHSLGCALVAHWARAGSVERVAGALLVAPADLDDLSLATPRSFSPLPLERLPFPSWVVGSRNDPYATFARAGQLARAWGGQLLDAGKSGHINVESGHGPWPRGATLLAALELELARRIGARRETDAADAPQGSAPRAANGG